PEKKNDFEVRITYVLNILSFKQFSRCLDGRIDVQEQREDKNGAGDDIPNITWHFGVLGIMLEDGRVLVLLGLVGMMPTRGGMFPESNIYLKIMPFAIILPFIANTAGWLLTEMGRQPWVVFGLMKTEDAISHSVTANEMLFSLIAFTLMYTVLGAVSVYLFVRHIKKNHEDEHGPTQAQDPFD